MLLGLSIHGNGPANRLCYFDASFFPLLKLRAALQEFFDTVTLILCVTETRRSGEGNNRE